MEACYYVPVTSMISGAIVGSAAPYVWHLQAAIRGRMSGRFLSLLSFNPPFSFRVVPLKVLPFFRTARNYLFTVLSQHFVPPPVHILQDLKNFTRYLYAS